MDKLKIQQDRVDLKTMVDENIRLFDSMQMKATTIYNNIPEGTVAIADTNMVNLVFRNLILNAIKFTESGGIVNINSSVQDDGLILISVADNGVGIEPEVQKILFEKTSGYSTRGTANEKGTGLGLILCKEFVEKNGGKIWLESKPGAGSTFYFTLKKA
jgi:signal transduction histidine kinase